MNRLDLLIERMKTGMIKDPDLHLCLHYINQLRIQDHEREPKDIQRTDPVPGEDLGTKPKRPQTKRL